MTKSKASVTQVIMDAGESSTDVKGKGRIISPLLSVCNWSSDSGPHRVSGNVGHGESIYRINRD